MHSIFDDLQGGKATVGAQAHSLLHRSRRGSTTQASQHERKLAAFSLNQTERPPAGPRSDCSGCMVQNRLICRCYSYSDNRITKHTATMDRGNAHSSVHSRPVQHTNKQTSQPTNRRKYQPTEMGEKGEITFSPNGPGHERRFS